MSDEAVIGGSTYASFANRNTLSQFPESKPEMLLTGLDAAPDIQLIDTQVYKVDIFQDYKVLDAKGTPTQTVWFTQGGGGTVSMPYHFWTDEYSGMGYITVPWEHLRLRDSQGYNSQERPYRVGEYGELGGKMIWQRCAIINPGTTVRSLTGWNSIDDDSTIEIVVPKSTSNWYDDQSEIKEIGLVQDSAGKRLVALGFSREGASSRFTRTIGKPYKVIEMLESTMRAKDYVGHDNMSVTWSRRSSISATFAQDSVLLPADCKTISYKYVEGTSKRFYLMLNNIDIAVTVPGSVSTVYQHPYAHRWVGVDQLIFTKDQTELIVVLDFAAINIDFVQAPTPITIAAYDALATDDYVQMVDADSTTYPKNTRAAADQYLFPGMICRHLTATDEITGTGNVAVLKSVLLLEEVNTAPASTAAVLDRVYSANVGASGKSSGGTTMFAPFVTINLHEHLPVARHEMEGFPLKEKTGYKFGTLSHMNFTRIHHSEPWSISIDSTNTEFRLKSTIEKNRKIYLEEFKMEWNTIFMYEKGQNLSDNAGFKGTSAGFMDREVFPVKHCNIPIPSILVEGNIHISDANAGKVYAKWLEDYAEVVFGNKQRSDSKNASVAIGKDLARMIRNVNSSIATQSGNVFGWNLITQVPTSELYLGIPTMSYDAGGDKIMFYQDQMLNDMVDWKLPYYLAPNSQGKASPRFLMVQFDKSNISVMTKKGRQEQIIGNLQPRNNPFIYTESVSASHMLMVRFCATNHSVTNTMPNYRG